MSETFGDWLSKSVRVQGVLAAAVYHPDGAVPARSASPDFEARAVEHALQCAADSFAVLRFQNLPAEWLRWEFEKASFYCVSRPDRACLGIFASKDPKQVNAAEIERLLTGFAKVTEGK
jgi:roadblock/LC7 domain-containing protein